MLVERQPDAVVVWAPAKVNLFLEVLAKRADGYHDIATLMVAVRLFDALEFREDAPGSLRLDCTEAKLSTGPDNLVWRAADLLRRHTGCARGAAIRLGKRIPMAAGLAGGSSDAAAALAGLNRLWRLGLTGQELAALGAQLGSDVAFFFSTPAAWCTGRGERVAPLSPGRPLWLVLVCPPVGVSTAAVYRGVTVPDRPESGDEVRRAFAAGDVEELGRRLHNRLQPVAERLCPPVAAADALLQRHGPAGRLMSGSGSSLFALCRDPGEATRIADALCRRPAEADPAGLPGQGWLVTVVRSCS
jgi:4-diphosphocytidyl-2-C-methyl-D-erythritol kinase